MDVQEATRAHVISSVYREGAHARKLCQYEDEDSADSFTLVLPFNCIGSLPTAAWKVGRKLIGKPNDEWDGPRPLK